MEITDLPTREQQVARTVYDLVEASPAEVRKSLPVRLSLSAVRTMLCRLESKQVVRRRKSVGRVTYMPVLSDDIRRAALARCANAYFKGSTDEMLKWVARSRRDSPGTQPRGH
ncbi:MAG TPA: BlaI/MecI/CopY family transcriptional regulator [Sphingomicrobium sp.]